MSGDNWKALPAAEWKRRLNQVRAVALQRLAEHGLSLEDAEEGSIASLFAYNGGLGGPHEIAVSLNPGLAVEHQKLDRLIAQVEDQGKVEISAVVCSYSIDVAETAFLFGVIMGCHLQWPVIEAMPAPFAPPKSKGGRK